VEFSPLGSMHMESLLDKLLFELNKRLQERHFRVLLGANLRAHLIKAGAATRFGGRALRTLFHSMVIDPVAERILAVPGLAQGGWELEWNAESQKLQWSQMGTASQHLLLPA